VNGTKTKERELHEENMSTHNSEGKTLCIHSVVIQPELRRKGLATKMLNEYIKRVVKKEEKVTLILLICKENLKGFYENCGFQYIGLSKVVHGKDQWIDMKLEVQN